MTMLVKLENYYRGCGVLSTEFACKHENECRGDCDNFTEAKSAFVGEHYGGGLPRLLLVSLDPGSSQVQRDPGLNYAPADSRTPEGVRQGMKERMCRVMKDPKVITPTLCGMNRVAQGILGKFDGFPDGKSVDVTRYYAHVNAVKCCMNKRGRKQADTKLFDNCRGYLRGEFDILSPNIIVSFGGKARRGVIHAFGGKAIEKWSCPRACESFPSKKKITRAGAPAPACVPGRSSAHSAPVSRRPAWVAGGRRALERPHTHAGAGAPARGLFHTLPSIRIVTPKAGQQIIWLHVYHPTAHFRKGESRRPFELQMDGEKGEPGLDGYAKLIREFIPASAP